MEAVEPVWDNRVGEDPPAAITPTLAPEPVSMDIRFTGSGSEYFRIWIVNLMLIVVTLGLYVPYAKVRRLRYFHENTLIGGSPLAFHGDPRRMLKGYLLVGALSLAYTVLSHTAPTAGLGVAVLIALLTPMFLHSALRYRLGQTSWRGLRLAFLGTRKEAYRVFGPVLVCVVLMLVVVLAASMWAEHALPTPPLPTDADIDADTEAPPVPAAASVWVQMLPLLLMLLFMGMLPWTVYRFKCYQHNHYALGAERTQIDWRLSALYGVWMRTSGVWLLTLVSVGVGVGLIAALGMFMAASESGQTWWHEVLARLSEVIPAADKVLPFLLGVAVFVFIYPLIFVVPKAYMTSRSQNLVWNHTRSAHVRFHSELRMGPLVWVLLKNVVLMMLTLGLYWPFAQVALQRLRLSAVSLQLSQSPELLTAALGRDAHDAAGLAADDLLGIDIDL